MAQRSSVEKLPTEIREAAYQQLRAGKTVREIVDHLQGMGADVSRSGVGRWKKSAEKSMKALQRATALGEGWAKNLKDDPEGKVGRLLIELGKTAALDTLLDRLDDEEHDDVQPLDVKSLFFLSSAVKNFENAGAVNAQRELKIRKEVVSKAAKAAEQIAKDGGMTADTIAKLRAAVIGAAG